MHCHGSLVKETIGAVKNKSQKVFMNKLFPRRKFIKNALAAGLGSGVVLSSWWTKVLAALSDLEISRVFEHGIASGDPTHDGVVLWTRINASGRTAVGWQVAADDEFVNVVQQGESITDDSSDYTVKIEVKSLRPGEVYYYRFSAEGTRSGPGRTRTLPVGPIKRLGIAVVSCSNYPFGYFNTYEEIASDEDIEFVVHLGDYIYEYGADGWGAEQGVRLARTHSPRHEIVSLADYRQRHGQYKTDRASRLMHASHPLIVTWDDHESANNPWVGGAQNHQPEEEGNWQVRREAALRAFYEWMPIRQPLVDGKHEELWRHFSFGDLASMTTIETRHTGRSLQVSYSDHLTDINSYPQRDQFLDEVLGNPNRTMLSKSMEDFLAAKLKSSVDSGKAWRILGNQIPMARTHVPDIATRLTRDAFSNLDSLPNSYRNLSRLGELDLPLYLDTWDGYPIAREKLYDLCRECGACDLIVLTGDSHAFWANELFNIGNQSMGVELGTTGVTSPGDFEIYGPQGAVAIDKLVAEHNREVVWTDCTRRGFVKLILTQDSAQADYIAVNTVDSEKYFPSLVRQMRITKKDEGLVFDD